MEREKVTDQLDYLYILWSYFNNKHCERRPFKFVKEHVFALLNIMGSELTYGILLLYYF